MTRVSGGPHPRFWLSVDANGEDVLAWPMQAAEGRGLRQELKAWPLRSQTGQMLSIWPPAGRSLGRDLRLQVTSEDGGSRRLSVELVAQEWSSDEVSPKEYLHETKRILEPCLREVRKSRGVRTRLTTAPARPARVCLAPGAKAILERFVSKANVSTLHPFDWQRFHVFIRYCHRHGVRLYPADLVSILEEIGFRHETAQYLSQIYDHGRAILSPTRYIEGQVPRQVFKNA